MKICVNQDCERYRLQGRRRRCAVCHQYMGRKLTNDQAQFVSDNFGLAVAMTQRYRRSIPFDDALSVASEALMRAAVNFQRDRGFAFSTYAGKSILLSFHREHQKRVERREISWDFQRRKLYMFTPMDEGSLAAVDEADEAPSQARRAAQLWATLNERERVVLSGRLGLHGPKRTLKAIAIELGLTQERVRQIALAAMRRLRKAAQPAS
jgi:RNA polymerase sigma factor (sigma-70 family)